MGFGFHWEDTCCLLSFSGTVLKKKMKKLLSHIFLLFIPLFSFAQWQSIEPMPTPREGLAAAELNGKIYAIGGKNQAGYSALDVVEIYDPVRHEWATGPSLINPRVFCAAASHGGKIFVFGGRNSSSLVQDIEMYDPAVGYWVEVGNMMPKREGLTATTRGDSIFVIAGKMQMMYSSHTSVFDPVNMTWQNNMGNCPFGRAGHGAALVGDDIYILGGVSYGMLSDVSSFASNSWVTSLELPIPVGNTSSASIGDSIFVIGGNTGFEATNSVLMYNTTAGTWTDFASLNEVRESHASILVDEQLYVIGGGRGEVMEREYLSSVEVYDLNTNAVSGHDQDSQPKIYRFSNYPNPFSESTNISITSQTAKFDNLPVIIYNMLGREVSRWEYPGWVSGSVTLNWNGLDLSGNPLPSGVYFVKIASEDLKQTQKISIIR